MAKAPVVAQTDRVEEQQLRKERKQRTAEYVMVCDCGHHYRTTVSAEQFPIEQ
jgi:hypothetical protein